MSQNQQREVSLVSSRLTSLESLGFMATELVECVVFDEAFFASSLPLPAAFEITAIEV
jgi:hypothetical protein